MRTFEEQQREFVQLALNLIENKQYIKLTLEYDYVKIHFYESRDLLLISWQHPAGYNETEIQKLRHLVGKLG